MRALTFLLLALGGLSATNSASAAEIWASDIVKYVYPLSDGNFIISLTTNPPACQSTANPKYLYVAVGSNGVTADGAKAMLATTLTAYAMGKPLAVVFEDVTGNCYVNRVLLAN